MPPKVPKTVEEIEYFLQVLQRYPEVYDKTRKGDCTKSRQRILRNKTWNEISRHHGWTQNPSNRLFHDLMRKYEYYEEEINCGRMSYKVALQEFPHLDSLQFFAEYYFVKKDPQINQQINYPGTSNNPQQNFYPNCPPDYQSAGPMSTNPGPSNMGMQNYQYSCNPEGPGNFNAPAEKVDNSYVDFCIRSLSEIVKAEDITNAEFQDIQSTVLNILNSRLNRSAQLSFVK
ncbi:hypothetical protein DMENIID0001_063570 [Sergentomyia squamirostris]